MSKNKTKEQKNIIIIIIFSSFMASEYAHYSLFITLIIAFIEHIESFGRYGGENLT